MSAVPTFPDRCPDCDRPLKVDVAQTLRSDTTVYRPHDCAPVARPTLPDDAECPGCGVRLTEENCFRRLEGTAHAVAPTDVPGVYEEDEAAPVFLLQCVTCAVENKE